MSVSQKSEFWPVPLLRACLTSLPQELQLRAAQSENARLVEENSRLSGRATEKEQVQFLPRPWRKLGSQGGLKASSWGVD